MIHLDFGVLIDRPTADVFQFITNLDNLPRWQNIVKEIKAADQKPMADGKTYHVAAEMMGRKLDGILTVEAFQPDSQFGYKMDAGPSVVHALITFKPVGTGTKLSLSGQAEPAGVLKIVEGAMQAQMKSQMEKNLNVLKTLLESGA
jgi:uncharacterized membrane protein